MGLRPRRVAVERGPDPRALPRDPARAGLPGLSRPQREAGALRPSPGGAAGRHPPHRNVRDAARGFGQRLLLLPPGGALLHGGSPGPGPGPRVRAAEGPSAGRRRAVAVPNLNYEPDEKAADI